MKKISKFSLLFILISVNITLAQTPTRYHILDSTEFTTNHPQIYIHPRPDNLWQRCTPDKPFFNTSGYAMVTDSINNYITSDTSIFELRFNDYNWYHGSFYIEIIHKYDFDVYNAGGIISFSLDSGKTWFNSEELINQYPNDICIDYASFGFVNKYAASDSLTDGTACFTGTITEWKKTIASLQFIIPLKKEPVDCYNLKRVWTRFTFISLPTAQQDNGWAIKKLSWGYFDIGGSINEINLAVDLNFQNPVQNKLVLNTNNKEHFTKILITDISGKEILKMNYSKEISLENLQSGLYFLYLTDRNEKTVYSKFIKE